MRFGMCLRGITTTFKNPFRGRGSTTAFSSHVSLTGVSSRAGAALCSADKGAVVAAMCGADEGGALALPPGGDMLAPPPPVKTSLPSPLPSGAGRLSSTCGAADDDAQLVALDEKACSLLLSELVVFDQVEDGNRHKDFFSHGEGLARQR